MVIQDPEHPNGIQNNRTMKTAGALRIPAGMLVKSQVVAAIATAVDFLVTVLFKEVLNRWYLFAVAAGAVAGAVIAFFLNRNWAFRSVEGRKIHQAIKYLLVVAGSWILNVSGVFLLCEFAGLGYLPAKAGIAILVGLTYNYTLAKRFVFI
ncbi:MAG: GtrA family protein [Bacteroidia bacterium]|nr:GtrA family protein [Bacteroidia bacterium]